MKRYFSSCVRSVGLGILTLTFLLPVFSAEVKFRTPVKTSAAPQKTDASEQDAETPTFSESVSSLKDVAKQRTKKATTPPQTPSEKATSDDETEPVGVAVETSTKPASRASGKASGATPTKPVPLSPEEYEKRYPRVQGATLMTLEYLIPTKILHNVRVLRAFTRVPRIEFVPKKNRDVAYQDVEILLDATMHASRPFDVACEIEALDPQETDRVLVVGVESGYHEAILSALTSEVYAVATDRATVKRAADACKKLKYGNVFYQQGDLWETWKEAAPFDKILVTRTVDAISSSLVDALGDGGKIVAPVGNRYRQLLTLGEKTNGEYHEKSLIPVRIEPLSADAAEAPAAFLEGGGFEETDPALEPGGLFQFSVDESEEPEKRPRALGRGVTPVGWYDAWNFEILSSGDAYEGRQVCFFSNEAIAADHEKKERNEERIRAATLPEERAEKTEFGEAVKKAQRERELHALMRQAFPLDGSIVKKAVLSGAYRASGLRSTDSGRSVKLVTIEFFDKSRKSLGETVVVEIPATPCSWQEFSREITIPARSREAILTIGLLDAVGSVEIDALSLRDRHERK